MWLLKGKGREGEIGKAMKRDEKIRRVGEAVEGVYREGRSGERSRLGNYRKEWSEEKRLRKEETRGVRRGD